MLAGGVNDLGGTLMEETISRMAGSRHGSAKTVAQLEEIVAGVPGRAAEQRDTLYRPVAAERHDRGPGLHRHAAQPRRRLTGPPATLPSLAAG